MRACVYAAKLSGNVETNSESVSTPPAEEPSTTRCEKERSSGTSLYPEVTPRNGSHTEKQILYTQGHQF